MQTHKDATLHPAAAADPALSSPSRRLLVGVAAIVLLTVSARIAVPLPGTPVPVTLQELAALVLGVVSGPLDGALSVAAYVLLGALGAPVFSAGNGGLAWLMGPTGGYLLAFPIAALVIGLATERRRPSWMVFPGLVAADLVIYGCGAAQLALVTGRPLSQAIALGVVPFLPGVAFKGVLLILFALSLRRWRGTLASAPAND